MKCKCGNDRFYTTQKLYVDVITDEYGNCIENRNGDIENSIVDSNFADSEYTCTECGRVYETLNIPRRIYNEI